MAAYLDQLPTIFYTFDPARQQFLKIKNLFARVTLLDPGLQASLVFYPYTVKDSDTAWGIASKYYGDPGRHWLVYLANFIIDPYFDWPLNTLDFQNNINLKYGSVQNAQANVHHINQIQNVSTTILGTTNTVSYLSTVSNAGLTYNFRLGQVQQQTLPTISNPIINMGSNTVAFANGVTVTTTTILQAVSNYSYEDGVNEAKRQIQLIDKTYVGSLETQYSALFSGG